MNNPSSISYRNLSEVVRGLAKVSGVSIPKIVDHEAARILEKCVSSTPAAQVQLIEKRYEEKEWILYASNNKHFRISGEGKGRRSKKTHKNRYPDALWARLMEQKKRSEIKRIARRGLSKQSWLELAALAGLEIKAPGFVKKLSSVNPSKNAGFQRRQGPESYVLNLRNAQPTIILIGGTRILKKAINGRVKYFETNLKKGVFADFEKFSKAYKGIVEIMPAQGGRLE